MPSGLPLTSQKGYPKNQAQRQAAGKKGLPAIPEVLSVSAVSLPFTSFRKFQLLLQIPYPWGEYIQLPRSH